MNVGQLFVKLGFKYDDRTLNNFDTSMKNAFNSALKLAGVTASLAGFKGMMDGASRSAVALDNLSLKYQIATDRAQRFMNAMMRANPNASRESAMGAYQSIANYAGLLPIQGAGTGAIFGVTADDNSPEKVIEKLRSNYQRVVDNYGPTQAAEWARAITGTDEALNTLLMTTQQYNEAAASGIVSAQDIEGMREYAAAIRDVEINAKALAASGLGDFMKGVADALKEIKQTGFMQWFHGFATKVGENSWIDTVGKHSPLNFGKDAGNWLNSRHKKDEAYRALVAKGIPREQALAMLGGDEAYGPPTAPPPPPSASSTRQAYARNFFKSMGWSDAQAAGMVQRLAKESTPNLKTDAVGDGGKAYGIAQWHPDRQAEFAKVMGKDIRGSSFDEQLQFINHELTKGKERGAGDVLRRMQTESDSYGAFTNLYERPAAEHRAPMTFNNTFNIQGGDPKQTEQAVMDAFKQINNGTNF